MATFVRITVLIWADLLAAYAMFVMMTYLTEVWKLNFTHAAGIVNIWVGLACIMPVGFAFLVDSFMGNYAMLLLSSIAYSIGLGFLTMSTPPVLHKSTDTCSEYHPECIGHTQKYLFYIALALISVGIGGHAVSLNAFISEQGEMGDDEKKVPWQIAGITCVLLVSIAGGIGLPYIKPWSIRFGIPAICTTLATLLFLSGSSTYKYNPPQGSPVTSMVRVMVASVSKVSHPCPQDANELYENHELGDDQLVPHSHSLRCLDKAAIVLPNPSKEEQEKNKWRLCSVTEVEETKICVHMLPMWLTFIVVGVVISIGKTYFLEQANHMSRKVGSIKVTLPIFLLFHEWAKAWFTALYLSLASLLQISKSKTQYASPIGIGVAMVCSILCCITAAKVETRRLNVIERHGLSDKLGGKPTVTIPMNIFWLLPQYLLLAAVDGISEKSISDFFEVQAPSSLKEYLKFFTNGVLGLGVMASVVLVEIVGKISERGGRKNWFQESLSKSRLDNYYWTLAGLSAVNLVFFILVAMCYPYKKAEKMTENAGTADQSQEDNVQCCC